MQYAAPEPVPAGGRPEEVADGGEKQVRLPLLARQCQQKPDDLRIGSDATRKFTVKRRPITDLVLGKPKIRGRHPCAVLLIHGP